MIVDSEDTADLLNLTADEIMKPAFEIGVTSYELKNNTGKINVTAQAQVEDATVCMYLKDSSQKESSKGKLSKEFTLYEGNNCIVVEVTAVDGKTKKVYELNVDARGLVYASDVIDAGSLEGITNVKAQAGYGNITLDTNVDGNAKILLVDENGSKVAFDKGLGAHASSEIIYTLEDGHEFQYFEAYAGVDYAKYSYDASTVSFEVWVDGQKAYDSAELLGGPVRATTPMQFVQVDVTGAREVELITKEVDTNAYDHSEWADACFTRSLGEKPEVEEKVSVTEIFSDVQLCWYTDAVQYAYDNGLMKGIEGTTRFEPELSATKAQVVQVLYNMEGQPEVTDNKVFTELKDVDTSEWYASAVAWAYNTGVITGETHSKRFNPNASVTREQLALIMYRYAKYKGFDTSASSDFAGLENGENTSDWALDGVKWAVSAGIISGIERDGIKDLAPQSGANRAQLATVLHRFCTMD